MKFSRMAVIAALLICSVGCGLVNETLDVAHDEFGPREALRKYEWFKDAAAQLDKKVADIHVYERRQKLLADQYAGVPRTKWDRTDKEQANQWESESVGLISSYNLLAAQYNSQMAKITWRFAEIGSLPPGADTPLPRDFKPYQSE